MKLSEIAGQVPLISNHVPAHCKALLDKIKPNLQFEGGGARPGVGNERRSPSNHYLLDSKLQVAADLCAA